MKVMDDGCTRFVVTYKNKQGLTYKETVPAHSAKEAVDMIVSYKKNTYTAPYEVIRVAEWPLQIKKGS